LLFIGRLSIEKNVKLLIKAIPMIEKGFKNFEVYIVGDGGRRSWLEQLAKELKVDKKVRFFGRVRGKKLVALYNFADLFVQPSLAELEGMVILEAMSCGMPVLIANSKDSASPDIVNKNGFTFNPRSPKDLAQKCLKLLKSEKLSKKMSDKSYDESKRYDIRKSIKETEEIYYSLVKPED